MKLKLILLSIEDKRRREGRRYDLAHILLLTLLAMVSGATTYRKIALYISERFEEFRELCDLKWKKPPAYTTLRDILLSVDERELERALRRHTLAGVDGGDCGVIAIDGKALRGSFDHGLEQPALMMVSAYAVKESLVLGHVMTENKGGELAAAQELIARLGLQGKLLTMDALHCQKNTSDCS